MLTRPSLAGVLAYREHVDAAVAAAFPALGGAARALVELGAHHEEQHQELLLTDILHLFAQNPLEPAYRAEAAVPGGPREGGWVEHPGGAVGVGHGGGGFAFDCEGPRHDVLLQPFRLAKRLVSNGEWLAFIADGSYRGRRCGCPTAGRG
jgi:formylglycine-generating enzyme required for sulfatase activity